MSAHRLAAALLALSVPLARAGVAPPVQLQPCWLKGVEHQVLCGALQRPLDPAATQGPTVAIHFAVIPALARNKKPDPVLFFAGGPGQSAIELAGPVSRMLARFTNRRDIVLIDQRGTGRSAPLKCDDDKSSTGLRDRADPQAQAERALQCRQTLQTLAHGDLRRYTTSIAMQDADAVRHALGVARVNLVGGSYGTRAALDYLRQFPSAVRRVVIDGVAPPDMALPRASSADAQAALDALLAWCDADKACVAAYPRLRAQWRGLLDGLPRTLTLPHPLTQRDETVVLSRDVLTSLVRSPLYVPWLAAGLPLAIDEASQGRWQALVGLAMAVGVGGTRAGELATGMHFSVVCSEDMPLVERSTEPPGPDFGDGLADLYRRVCSGWPRGEVPDGFYRIAPTASPVLVLSGGIDPVTPPRHGERVAQALGARARHVVVPNAGHGVMALPCLRDVVFRFVDADSDDQAAQVGADCARAVPRAPALLPLRDRGAR